MLWGNYATRGLGDEDAPQSQVHATLRILGISGMSMHYHACSILAVSPLRGKHLVLPLRRVVTKMSMHACKSGTELEQT